MIRKTVLDNSYNYWDLSKSIPRPIEIIQSELNPLQRFNINYRYKINTNRYQEKVFESSSFDASWNEKVFESTSFDASWNDISDSNIIEIRIDSTFKNINIYDDNGEIILNNIFSNTNRLLDVGYRLDIPDKIISNLYLSSSLLTNYTDRNYNIMVDTLSSYVLKKEGLINWINMQIRGNPYIKPPTSMNPHFKMYINSNGYTMDNSNSIFIEGFKNYINDFDPTFTWDVYDEYKTAKFTDVSDISMNELIDKGDISYNWPIKLSHNKSKDSSSAELLFDGYQMKDIINEIDNEDNMDKFLKLADNTFDSIYYYKEDAFIRDTFTIDLSDGLFKLNKEGSGEELFIRNQGSLFIELSNNNINSFKDRSKNKLVTGYLQNILKLVDGRTDSEYKRITIDILTQDNYSNVLNYLYTDENKLKFSDSSIEINTPTAQGSPSWHDISNQILFTSNDELPIIVNRHRSDLSNNINKHNINVYYEVYDFETNDISFVKVDITSISHMTVNIPNVNGYIDEYEFDSLFYDSNKSGITGSFYKIKLNINSLENYYIQENNTIVLTNNITSTTQDSSENYIYDTNWDTATYPDTDIKVYNDGSALFGGDEKIAFFKYSQQNILKEYKPDKQDYDNNNSLILTNIINENDISFNLSYVINVDTYDTDLITNDHTVFNPITELGIFETIDLSFGDIFIGSHHNIAKTKDLSYVAWGMNNYKQINQISLLNCTFY